MATRRDALRLLTASGIGWAAGDVLALRAQAQRPPELLIRGGQVGMLKTSNNHYLQGRFDEAKAAYLDAGADPRIQLREPAQGIPHA